MTKPRLSSSPESWLQAAAGPSSESPVTWPPPQGLQEGAPIPDGQVEKWPRSVVQGRKTFVTVYNSTWLKKINHLGSFHTHMLNTHTGEGKLCPLHAALLTPGTGRLPHQTILQLSVGPDRVLQFNSNLTLPGVNGFLSSRFRRKYFYQSVMRVLSFSM